MNKLNVTPLTSAQMQELKEFIGDCVMSNRTFNLFTGRLGSTPSLTIQEIVNANLDTLKSMGEQLEKTLQSKTSVSSIFGGSNAETYKVSGVEATKLVEMLKFIIINKLVIAHRQNLERELQAAKVEAGQFETNSEKKKKAQAALKAKQAELNSFTEQAM